jgi:hypothetical protein
LENWVNRNGFDSALAINRYWVYQFGRDGSRMPVLAMRLPSLAGAYRPEQTTGLNYQESGLGQFLHGDGPERRLRNEEEKRWTSNLGKQP